MISRSLIGSGKAFTNVLEEIRMVAPLECSVLIQGETGTGKEVVARAIHNGGKRRDRPFITLNCAAISSFLLESELFGHEKGAYTGAVGGFQAAQGGTLFLDEIGDLPLELQPKLLRVLQEQQFERVGSARTIQADVRVIGATNLPLREMVEEKSFRADLFYRLSVFPLELPPLRERKDDIDELVHHFVRIYSARLGKDIVHVPEAILETMHGYHWPGNIRELQNFIERAVITSPGDTLSPRAGELELLSRCRPVQRVQTLLDAERAHIIQALTETNWVVGGRNGAAARLGLPRTTLISRMQKLGLLRKRSEQPLTDFSLPQSFSDSQSGQIFSTA